MWKVAPATFSLILEIFTGLNKMLRKLELSSKSNKLRRTESIKYFVRKHPLKHGYRHSIVSILSQGKMKIPVFISYSHLIQNMWNSLIGFFDQSHGLYMIGCRELTPNSLHFSDPSDNLASKSRNSVGTDEGRKDKDPNLRNSCMSKRISR
jgi:hypothetical protein